jgi:hypothetical protein
VTIATRVAKLEAQYPAPKECGAVRAVGDDRDHDALYALYRLLDAEGYDISREQRPVRHSVDRLAGIRCHAACIELRIAPRDGTNKCSRAYSRDSKRVAFTLTFSSRAILSAIARFSIASANSDGPQPAAAIFCMSFWNSALSLPGNQCRDPGSGQLVGAPEICFIPLEPPAGRKVAQWPCV